MQATGFHTTNILLHLANSVLLYFVALNFLNRYQYSNDKKLLSFLTALLFLCYAFHSEPIFWVVARGGSLVALFMQLSLLFYFKGGIANRVFGLVFFTVALFTYELSWIVPLLLTLFYLYDVYIRKQKLSYLPITVYWYLLSGYLFLRYYTLKGSLNAYEFGNVLNNNVFHLLYNYAALVARVFIPPAQNSAVFLVLFLLLVALLVFVFVYLFKKDKSRFYLVLLLFACVLTCLLPVLSLGIDTHDSESERFIYPATIFACLLIVVALHSCFKNFNRFAGTLAGVLIFHLFFLQQSAAAYRYASYVSKFTIDALNEQPNVKQLYFTNLPAQYKGALIFRIGFPVWAPGILNTTYKAVQIHSFKELTQKQKLVKVVARKSNVDPELHVEFKNDTLKLY